MRQALTQRHLRVQLALNAFLPRKHHSWACSDLKRHVERRHRIFEGILWLAEDLS